MKKIICAVFALLTICAGCNNSNSNKEEAKSTDTVAAITFDSKNYQFGEIVKGEIVEHTYTFTNTGTIDLQIQEVDPSCGCTTPEWTQEPIKPGQKGKIRVKFDTQHQSYGNKQKQVSVYSNTIPSRNILQFSAVVVEK
ncbi:MAG: DUF1573 domain-containing protein [Bacteroidales bacterium]|nr:DUF1573 domain-containing protein [Bacteroidales bacterium]